MRMDEMNSYFESKGFKVKREYHSSDTGHRGYYTFDISKNNNHRVGTYVWPEDQQFFMDRMIEKFEAKFDKEPPRCKDFLVWTNSRIWMMDAVAMTLNDLKIPHTVHRYNSAINTRHILIKFTNRKSYIEQDGLNWDEIFIDTEKYPDILDQRTDSGVWHGGDLLGAIIDQIYKTEDKFRPKRNDAMMAYVEACSVYENFLKNHIFKVELKDIEISKELHKMFTLETIRFPAGLPKIKNVIFNDPATIVFWSDGTKTVVKAQDGDIFDPEKGLALAISKKALGNKGNYCNELKKWLPKEEEFESLDLWEIKIPQYYKQVSDIQKKVYNLFGLKKDTKLECVQKAYDILVKARDGDIDYSTLLHPIEEAIGYLGEALED